MHIFFDESGSFSWATPAISVMPHVIVPTGALSALESQFLLWKRVAIGQRKGELKGSSLSDAQLLDFVQAVLPVGGPKIVVGVVGVDTAQTQELHVAQARDQLARQFAHVRDLLLARNPPNKSLAQAYDELGNWTKNRSAVNFLWLWCAEESIWQSIQHAIAYFLEPDEDHEFEEIEITVDQSFIRRERHIEFWQEVLRLGLSNRSTTGRSFMVPTEWRERNHPFCRKYNRDGYRDYTDLYRKHLVFTDSRTSIGIQIADICAQICRRFHRGDGGLEAYAFLRRRIVGKDGVAFTMKHFNQSSLHEDAEANHVVLRTSKQTRELLSDQRDKR
jgi:hypothetical protein